MATVIRLNYVTILKLPRFHIRVLLLFHVMLSSAISDKITGYILRHEPILSIPYRRKISFGVQFSLIQVSQILINKIRQIISFLAMIAYIDEFEKSKFAKI